VQRAAFGGGRNLYYVGIKKLFDGRERWRERGDIGARCSLEKFRDLPNDGRWYEGLITLHIHYDVVALPTLALRDFRDPIRAAHMCRLGPEDRCGAPADLFD